MLEAERLEGAAWALNDQAGKLDASGQRLKSRFDTAIDCGSWKGPAARNAMNAAQARYDRMCRTRDVMRDLAGKFRWQAQQIRAKAEQERLAQRHLA